jgi:hypothetical protein
MAAKDRAQHSAETGAALVEQLRENAYVQRLIEDAKLRDTIQEAVEHGRKAYGRASNAKNPGKALLNDKKLQKQLRTSYIAAKSATTTLRDAPNAKAKKSHTFRRLVLFSLFGGIVALAASSGARSKVLDLLFGPEETFDYTPTSNGNGTGATAPTGTPVTPPASS